jgi:hypothetical protein
LLSVTAMNLSLKKYCERDSGTKRAGNKANIHSAIDQRIAPWPEDRPIRLERRAARPVDVEQRCVRRVKLRDPCDELHRSESG